MPKLYEEEIYAPLYAELPPVEWLEYLHRTENNDEEEESPRVIIIEI